MATVRVVGSGASGAPYRGVITPLDGVLDDAVILPYNPESYTIDHKPGWQAHGLVARSDGANGQTWVGNAPSTLKYRHTLTVGANTTLVQGQLTRDADAEAQLETLIDSLERWTLQPADRTNEPPRLSVIFGQVYFTGVLSALSVTRVRTNERGQALVADLSLEFTGERV